MSRTTIPQLYPADAKSFNVNGFGFLSDGIDCTVVEELNTSFELTLEYPVTGAYYDLLQIGNIIYSRTNTHNEKRQPFRIYRITKPIDGVVTVYAQHVTYDLAGYAVDRTNKRYENTKADVQTIIDFIQRVTTNYANTMGAPQFTISCEGTFEPAQWSVTSFTNVRSIMQQAAKQFNGQWEYDGYRCILHDRRGADNGVSIEYGKNLSGITEDSDVSETYTHVMPYYNGRTEDDIAVTVGGLSACIATGAEIGCPRTKPLDLSSEFSRIPTVKQLQDRAAEYAAVEELGKIVINRDVEAVDRGRTIEYPGMDGYEVINVGDTIQIIVPVLNINAAMTCMTIRYNAYLDRVLSYEIGHVKKNFISALKKEIIDDYDSKLAEIDEKINELEEKVEERAPTLFVQEEEPESTEDAPLVSGDYWLKIDSKRNAVSFHKYSGSWSLLCNFLALPEVIISAKQPDSAAPDPEQYDIWINASYADKTGDDADKTLSDVDASTISGIYDYTSEEQGGVLQWVKRRYSIGENVVPGVDVEVGDYWFTTEKADKKTMVKKLFICTEVKQEGSATSSTWKEVYPNDETGHDPTISVSTDKPITKGVYWIKLDSDDLMIAEAVFLYDAEDNKMKWVLQYNLQGTVYYDTNAPKSDDLKKGDIWVKIQNGTNRLAQQVGRYDGSKWIVQFQLAEQAPYLFVQPTVPTESYVKLSDLWFKTDNDTEKNITALYRCTLKQDTAPAASVTSGATDELYQWDLLGNISGSGGGVGEWLDGAHTIERFNDYEDFDPATGQGGNWSVCPYDHIEGRQNHDLGTSGSGCNLMTGGYNTVTKEAQYSFIGGRYNTVDDNGSVTACIMSGYQNTISYHCYNSLVTGTGVQLSNGECNNSAIIAEGCFVAKGINSSAIIGKYIRTTEMLINSLVVGYLHQISSSLSGAIICGECADFSTPGILIAAGGGSPSSPENKFLVNTAGAVYAKEYNTLGADYAEYFEWADGNPDNEDRCGMLVSLDGDKIVPADGYDIVGVVSANPSVTGNSGALHYHGKYKTDVFGRVITDEDGKPVLSEDFDPEQRYIPRSNRPEWAAVGLVGRLIITDDGSCRPGGYVSAIHGAGTSCEKNTGLKVLRRVDETHVEIFIR